MEKYAINQPFEDIPGFPFKTYTEIYEEYKRIHCAGTGDTIYIKHEVGSDRKVLTYNLAYTEGFLLEKMAKESPL